MKTSTQPASRQADTSTDALNRPLKDADGPWRMIKATIAVFAVVLAACSAPTIEAEVLNARVRSQIDYFFYASELRTANIAVSCPLEGVPAEPGYRFTCKVYESNAGLRGLANKVPIHVELLNETGDLMILSN